MYFDTFQQDVADAIRLHTTTNDKLVVWGLNWGDPFLRSGRQGFTGGLQLDSSAWINDPANLTRLRQMGYTKVVLVNSSPYVVALTALSHNENVHWVDLQEHLPTVARDWPVLFDSKQLLIVQIPPGTSMAGAPAPAHTAPDSKKSL